MPSYNRTGGLHGKKTRAKFSYNRTGGLRLLRHIWSGSPFVVIAIRIGGNKFNRAKTIDNSRQV